MVSFKERFHRVKLVGLNQDSILVLSYSDGIMYLMEYDDRGRPLNIAPNGKQGIFCISPDGFYNTWFILDEDVRFDSEIKAIRDIINKVTNDKLSK